MTTKNQIVKPKSAIRLVYIMALSAVLSVLCTWSYGNSYVAYVVIAAILAVYGYWGFVKKLFTHCTVMELLLLLCLLINLAAALFVGSVQSFFMTNIALVLPFAVASTDIDMAHIGKDACLASLITLMLMMLLDLFVADSNVNTQAILMYTCMSISYVWLLNGRAIADSILCLAYLAIMLFMILTTGSRNTILVALASLVLALVFRFFSVPKWLFRCVYITAMTVTIFAIPFMTWVFENEAVLRPLEEFAAQISNKEWGMDTHLRLLQLVKRSFDAQPWSIQLIGNGIKLGHCHNLFYQCLYFYGYIGTIGIYAFYVYVFETGYKLFKKYNDKLSLACCMMLIGFFILQCAEVFMLGSETASMIGALPTGLILYQQRAILHDDRLRQRKPNAVSISKNFQ